MNVKLLLFLASFLRILVDCSDVAGADTTPDDIGKVVSGNTEFAIDLYGKLRAGGGNVFFSPYSISTALAMAYGGARSATARDMAQTLHFDLPPEKLHPAFGALNEDINTLAGKGQIEIAVANSLWPQSGFTFLSNYLGLCETYYYSPVTPLDYAGHAEESRKTINGWVERVTNRKIVELLTPGVLNSSTRIVLVNAIYFKGKWERQFKPDLTRNAPFHVSLEKSSTAALMQQTDDFRYAELPNLQVLELPYKGGDVSMVIVLPRKTDGLGDIEAQLTATNLALWTAGLQSRKVEVFLPKFRSTCEFLLGKTLAALGMAAAFTSEADFSGMDGRKDLFISAVIHKAFVDVNEEGTEAAAATALFTVGSAPQEPPTFRADHPFLFFIRDNGSGSVLFMGRVTHPSQ